jgi:hypothetical protein
MYKIRFGKPLQTKYIDESKIQWFDLSWNLPYSGLQPMVMLED